MGNSALVSYTKLSPNRNSPRNHVIDTISIHCAAGHGTAKDILNLSRFVKYDPVNGVSCNYAVGDDGSIGLGVPESDRSWCTSSPENDHRAITIEVASDAKEPYAVTDKAYSALLDLVADICKRNGIKKLVWSTVKRDRVNHLNGCNMTVHRDYAKKDCPGTYLYERMGKIAEEVNKRLGVVSAVPDSTVASGSKDKLYRVRKAWTEARSQIGAYRDINNAKNACVPGYMVFDWNGKVVYTPKKAFKPYTVRITCDVLNIRKEPTADSAVAGKIADKKQYTIVEEKPGKGSTKGWGKLKSGAGWIALDWVKKS